MKLFNKILTFAVCAAMCITFLTGAVLAETAVVPAAGSTVINSAVSTGDMAEALNNLNILKGSNGEYFLEDNMERAQAAAFIIRILGKEDYVKQNAEQFRYTSYADVPSGEWYAPYVGYCTQFGIIGGNPDGSFAPVDYISEKAFLKMVLCALGYTYGSGEDFNWSNVYQMAYTTGVVGDPAYASRTEDNDNYLRSEAVEVLYRALNTFRKSTTTKMVFNLADQGIFTREEISASGIFGPDTATEIDVVTATAPNSIEINLNETITNVNTADISIYETTSSSTSGTTGSSLSIQSVAFAGDRIQIITAGQVPGKNYVVRINSVTDTSGNISGILTGNFKGFVQQQTVSDFFKISKIEQSSANVINVYFTHPLNTNSETPAYYELTKNGVTYLAGTTANFTVKQLKSVNNAVSIYFNNSTLNPGEVYGVKVSGRLTSSYGVKLGEGLGDSRDFVTTVVNAGELSVSAVYAWSSTSVRIMFNREVDPVWAEKFLNYTVYDVNKVPITVTKAVIDNSGEASGRIVMLNLASSLDKTRQYEVRMEYIPDIYKQSIIEGKSFPFSGAYPENSGLALTNAVSDYNNCVVLIFNKALDKATAENKSNYIIRGVNDSSFNVVPEKAYYEDIYGMYVVKLFLPAGKTFSSSQKYRVYPSGLKDSLGTPQLMLQAEFAGGGNGVVKPQIVDAVTVSKDAVKLMFNIEIAFNMNNMTSSNYSLEYVENGETLKMIPIGVTYVDARTLVLRFDELDASKSYQLRFEAINDYSGVYTRTAADGGNSIAVRWGK